MRMGPEGRISIPAEMQRAAGLVEGGEFVIRLGPDGGLAIETPATIKRRLLAAAPHGDWDSAADARSDQADEEAENAQFEAQR